MVNYHVLFVRAFTNLSADLKVWGFPPAIRRCNFFGVPRLLSKRESQCFDLLGWMNSYPKESFSFFFSFNRLCSIITFFLLLRTIYNTNITYATNTSYEWLPVRIENGPSRTILAGSSYFAQRYPSVSYFQKSCLQVLTILIFWEICENLKKIRSSLHTYVIKIDYQGRWSVDGLERATRWNNLRRL